MERVEQDAVPMQKVGDELPMPTVLNARAIAFYEKFGFKRFVECM